MENNEHTDTRVTDLAYLTTLSKGDTLFIKEMIRIFLEENPREVLALETSIRENNFEGINVAAHKLRSTAPFVGIDKLIEKNLGEMIALAENNSILKKIEINPGDNPEIQKIEIVTSDKTVIERLEKLFNEVREVCERAREELVLLPPNFTTQV
jgi:HPt (histidine-containing phosphotransfer) domain-containing protein